MIAYGQIRTRRAVQEWYETSSRDARRRAAQLRRLGYRVAVQSMGQQVTPVGRVAMTLVDIRPGDSGDETLERVPPVRVERMNPYIGFEKLKAQLAKRPDVYDPAGLAAWIGRRKYGHARFQRAAAAGRKIKGAKRQNAEQVLVRSASASSFRRRRGPALRAAQALADAARLPVALVDRGRRAVLALVRPKGRANPGLKPARMRVRRSADGRKVVEIRG